MAVLSGPCPTWPWDLSPILIVEGILVGDCLPAVEGAGLLGDGALADVGVDDDDEGPVVLLANDFEKVGP